MFQFESKGKSDQCSRLNNHTIGVLLIWERLLFCFIHACNCWDRCEPFIAGKIILLSPSALNPLLDINVCHKHSHGHIQNNVFSFLQKSGYIKLSTILGYPSAVNSYNSSPCMLVTYTNIIRCCCLLYSNPSSFRSIPCTLFRDSDSRVWDLTQL